MIKFGKSTVLVLVVILTLIVNIIFPATALADGAPTDEPIATEAAPPSEGGAPTEEVLPSEDVTQTPETIIQEAAPIVEAETTTPNEDLIEIVEAMSEAGVILADENGEPIPLATQAAVNALSAPDPMGCPPGVQPVSWGGTGAGCTASYSSIQNAINDVAVSAGWTIYIDPGEFYENVTVNKSVTLQGSGAGVTIVYPGSASTPDLGCGAGSCPSNTNTVFLITANNVTIRDLTVNGNNPNETSGVVVNGEDINARNGIYGDNVDNLTIENTEIKNIYLRGIQINDGDNFIVRNNEIDNVTGDAYYSIAFFNYRSSGSITGNQLTRIADGIASNWSQGTQVLNNTISDLLNTGVHTDNMQASDTISGNTVFNGGPSSYGIFAFAPYVPLTIDNNTISNVAVGLALSGNGSGSPLNTVTFSDNQVAVSAGGMGAYVTTDVWQYFFSDASAVFNDNTISGGDYGFYFESNGAGDTYNSNNHTNCSGAGGDCILNVSGTGNSITGQSLYAAAIAQGSPNWSDSNPAYFGIYNVDLRGNWWGDPSGPLDTNATSDSCQTAANLYNLSGLGGEVSDCILYDDWLTTDPFPTPVTPSDFDDNLNVRSDFIRCDQSSALYTFNHIDVTFVNLCGYRMVLKPVAEGQVRSALAEDQSLLYGVEILLFKNEERVDVLPAGAQIIVSYPELLGIPMRWSAVDSAWYELWGSSVKRNMEVSTQPGVNILVSQP